MGIVARQHSSSVDGFIADRHGDQPAIPAWRAPMVMAPIMYIMLSRSEGRDAEWPGCC